MAGEHSRPSHHQISHEFLCFILCRRCSHLRVLLYVQHHASLPTELVLEANLEGRASRRTRKERHASVCVDLGDAKRFFLSNLFHRRFYYVIFRMQKILAGHSKKGLPNFWGNYLAGDRGRRLRPATEADPKILHGVAAAHWCIPGE